jgi:hypothetical protein
MIRDVHSGSWIQILIFTHPGSRIQGSKRQWIPDLGPQHCKFDYCLMSAVIRDIIIRT